MTDPVWDRLPIATRDYLRNAAEVERLRRNDHGQWIPFTPAAFLGPLGALMFVVAVVTNELGYWGPQPDPDGGVGTFKLWFLSICSVSGLISIIMARFKTVGQRRSTIERETAYAYFAPDLVNRSAWLAEPLLRLPRAVSFGLFGATSGAPHRRLIDSRRWATLFVVNQLIALLALVVILFVGLSTLLWHLDVITPATPLSRFDFQKTTTEDLLWNTAQSIPALDLTTVLQWPRPRDLAGDRVFQILLTLFKISIITPALLAIVDLARGASAFQPATPIGDRVVASAISAYLETSDKQAEAERWHAALSTDDVLSALTTDEDLADHLNAIHGNAGH